MSAGAEKALGPVFEALNWRVAMLNALWQTYSKLFATNPERIKLLDENVRGFANILHELLVDGMILGICRVTDPAATKGFKNLTIDRLLAELSPAPNAELAAWIAEKKAKIDQAIQPLKDHRNKRIGHIDLDHALEPDAELPPVLRSEIKEITADISGLMTKLSETYCNRGIYYGDRPVGDADNFVAVLQRAERLSELQDDLHFRRLPGEQILKKLAERSLPSI